MSTNKKAYMREYSRRRRLGKIEELRPQLPRKKDIFEVAAKLNKGLQKALDFVPIGQLEQLEKDFVGECNCALAAYRQYWEED